MNTAPETNEIIEIRSILTALVMSIVTHPENVKVESSEHGPLVAFRIRTEQEDVRRVIGTRGKHYKALEGIAASLCKLIDRESHIIVDDKGPPPNVAPVKGFVYSRVDTQKFDKVQPLLRRVISPFLLNPDSMDIDSSEIGTTTIFVVKVKAEDYPQVYGPEIQFDYGTDGAIIGAIKNIFDGIGKNHGRIIRVVLQPNKA